MSTSSTKAKYNNATSHCQSYSTGSAGSSTLVDQSPSSTCFARNRQEKGTTWPLARKDSSSALSTSSTSSNNSSSACSSLSSTATTPHAEEKQHLLDHARTGALGNNALQRTGQAQNVTKTEKAGHANFDWTFKNAVVSGNGKGYGRHGLAGGLAGQGRGNCGVM